MYIQNIIAVQKCAKCQITDTLSTIEHEGRQLKKFTFYKPLLFSTGSKPQEPMLNKRG